MNGLTFNILHINLTSVKLGQLGGERVYLLNKIKCNHIHIQERQRAELEKVFLHLYK